MAVKALTRENFDSTIADNDIVIIDFWADWCGPCKMFKPVFEKASERHQDVAFVTCDTEAQPELATSFQIRSIPTTVVFRKQIPVFFQPGMLPPEAIDELLGRVRELDMAEVRKSAEAEAARA